MEKQAADPGRDRPPSEDFKVLRIDTTTQLFAHPRIEPTLISSLSLKPLDV
jgi:hypothetical protein